MNEKMKAADELSEAVQEYFLNDGSWTKVINAINAYDDAGPWPAPLTPPLEVGDEEEPEPKEGGYRSIRQINDAFLVKPPGALPSFDPHKLRVGNPIDWGDESADPDLGPRNDLLAGLTTALRVILDIYAKGQQMPGDRRVAINAMWDILSYHPEPDVGHYLMLEVERLGT